MTDFKRLIGQREEKSTPVAPEARKIQPVQEPEKPRKKRKRKTMMDESEPELSMGTLLGASEKKTA